MTARNSTALQTTFAVLAVLSAAVFWAGNGIGSKILFRPGGAHFDAVGLFTARAAWSLPIFLVLAWLGRPARPPDRADRLRLLGLGLAFGPGACGFLALGAQYTSGAHIMLLMTLVPAVTAALGAVFLHERITRIQTAALVIGLAGTALLTLTRSTTGSSLAGDLLELVQVLALGVMFVLTRTLGGRYTPIFITGVNCAIGMAALLAIGTLLGRLDSVTQPLTRNASTLGWFFGEIVIGLSIYSQFAQAYALRTLDAATFSLMISYATLVIGLIGSVWLLGERIAPSGYAAGVLLAIALGLSLSPRRRAIVS
jgi:drug/metabolite transporter (DMT)-like permease